MAENFEGESLGFPDEIILDTAQSETPNYVVSVNGEQGAVIVETPGAGAVRVDGDDILISPTAADLVAANPELGGGGASNVGNSLFVDKDGVDATGTRERFDKPFLTYAAAKAVALTGDTIYVRPGTYNASNLEKAGIVLNVWLEDGAIISYTGSTKSVVDDGPDGAAADITLNIGGDGVITSSASLRPTINVLRAGSVVNIKARQVKHTAVGTAAVWQENGMLNMDVPDFQAVGQVFYWRGGGGHINFQTAISSGGNAAELYELIAGPFHWHLNGDLLQGADLGCWVYGGAHGGGTTFDINRAWITIQKIYGTNSAVQVDGSVVYFELQKAESSPTGTGATVNIAGGTVYGEIFKIEGGTAPGTLLGLLVLSGGRSFLSVKQWEDTGQTDNACIYCLGGYHDLDVGSMLRKTNGWGIYMEIGGQLRIRKGIIDVTGQPRTITSNTQANPTVVTTDSIHFFENGGNVFISGSNSTPTINGTRVSSLLTLNPTKFTAPVNVTVAGTAGTVTFFDPSTAYSPIEMVGAGTLILEAEVTVLAASGIASVLGTGAGETVICKDPWFNTDVESGVVITGSYNLLASIK